MINYESKNERDYAEFFMGQVAGKYGLESQEAISFCNLVEKEVKKGNRVMFNAKIGSRLEKLGI